jgi:hypothetical protein
VPGSVLVAEETMFGWKEATNIHITFLPNKPTGKGVCLKTLVHGHTRVMTAPRVCGVQRAAGIEALL